MYTMNEERKNLYKEAVNFFKDNKATIKEVAEIYGLNPNRLSIELKNANSFKNVTKNKLNNLWEEINNYYLSNDCTVTECAKKFGVQRITIRRSLERANITIREDEQYKERENSLEKAVLYYKNNPTESKKSVAEKFGVCRVSLADRLKKQNIPNNTIVTYKKDKGDYLANIKGGKKSSKVTVDHNYFKTIDSKDKAYWLGFINADGSIQKDKKISIGLAIRDFDHLYRFKKSIKYTGKINEYDATLNGKKYPSCKISIISKIMFDDLKKQGINERKSKKEKPPISLSKIYIKDYLRGYFDGDGWVSIYNRDAESSKGLRSEVGFCGSYEMMNYIKDLLKEETGVELKVKPISVIYEVKTSSIEQSIKILKYLYDNTTLYLPRKKEKAEQVCRLLSMTIEGNK